MAKVKNISVVTVMFESSKDAEEFATATKALDPVMNGIVGITTELDTTKWVLVKRTVGKHGEQNPWPNLAFVTPSEAKSLIKDGKAVMPNLQDQVSATARA
jgi:hypothetical protein